MQENVVCKKIHKKKLFHLTAVEGTNGSCRIKIVQNNEMYNSDPHDYDPADNDQIFDIDPHITHRNISH